MPSESNTIDDFGKSITNDFNITVANLVVNEDALVKGDLTVLGDLTFDNLNINNLAVENATITDLILENPLPTTSGGTGLATIGTAGQVLAVNSTGTGLVYASNTQGSVTSVTALSPLSSSGGTTPTISIPLTTGTGSTVVLKTAPDLIGPVTVEGDINAENGSVGLVARYDLTEPSASISMNTFSNKNSRIRTSNDVEFRIDNIGLGQRKKMKLMADSVTVTRQETSELADGFYVDLPTTIRNETFIRETFCSDMLNFPQSVSLPNENGIRMYSGTNKDDPRFELGITSGDFYPATSSSYFKIADVSGVFSVTFGTGSVSYNLGTGNFSVTTGILGNINFLCAGIGAVTTQTAGVGGISLACLGTGAISLAATSGLISLTSGTIMTFNSTTTITHNSPTSIFNSFCVMNRTVNISGLLSCQGGASISGGVKFFGQVAFGGGLTVTGTSKMTGPTNVTGAFTVTGSSTVSGSGTFRGGITIQGRTNATGSANFSGPIAVSGNSSLFGQLYVSGFVKIFKGISIAGKTDILGPLNVTGTTTLKGTTNVTGSFTVTGSSTVSGAGTFRGGITIQGRTNANGSANFTGPIAVSGNSSLFGQLYVSGFAKLFKGISIAGKTDIVGAMTVSGKSSLNGGMSVTGLSSMTGNLSVSGISTVNGLMKCNAGLTITGATSATGIFNIAGATKITGALNVTGSISSQGAFTLQGGGNITGALGVQGATSITGPLVVTGPTNTSGLLTATGGAAITGLTFITGATQISGALNITGTLSTQGIATFLSSTYMLNGIGVTGGTTINTVGQRCDITGGKITLKSEVDAVNIIAPEGGFNIGSSFAGGVVGAVRIETQNGFTQFATGNIDIRTTTKSPYVGNGNISINTLNAYSGDIYIYSKARVSIAAANASPGQSGADPQAVSFDTSIVTSGGYNFKFPATIGTSNSIFLSGGSSDPLSWLAPGAANTFLKSDGTTLSWSTSSSFTDWANPGAIGSGTANTGAFTSLTANANFNTDQLNLNPGLTVYSNQGYIYGMDLGYNVTTSRYRTRIFCPNAGTGDISLSTYTYNPLLPITQTRFTDRLIVRGDTGNIELLSNTSLTGTFSSTGNVLVNSSNLTNTVSFNPAVTVFSDTLNAYGMDLGYNDSVSRYRTRIFCPALSVADIALSTRAQNGTDQSAFTDRLVVRGGTGEIEMLSKTTFTALLSGSFSDSPFTFINTATMPLFTSAVLAPNVASGNVVFSAVGKSLTPGNCLFLGYNYTPIPSSVWSMFNSNTSITQIFDGNISIVAPVTTTSGTVTIGGYLRVSGDVPIISAGSGVCMGLQADGFAVLTLNGTGTNGGYIDFSQDGTDFHTRIMGLVTKQMEYTATTHIFQSFISDVYSPLFKINGGISSNIELLTNSTVSGYLRVFGNVPTSSAGIGVCMGLQNDGYAAITLNGTGAQAGYIDFSQNGTDFYCRIMGKPSKELEFSADTYTFQNTAQDISFLLLNNIFTANIRGTAGILGNCFVNSANISNIIDLNPALTVYNNQGYKYGIDLGYNLTSLRFRTRIFCPNMGDGDISLATANLNPTLQSDFTDRLIVRGDTGNVEITSDTTISANLTVTTGNIIGNQNIVENITVLNNGNLALNVNSPGVVLIRGGSGSTITLPNANTLITGFSYIINNNSNHNAIVNQFESGSVGTVIPGNSAHIICYNTNSLNGQWDIHISGTAQTVDWANPGTIGSATPNTGAFTTLTATSFIKANSNNSTEQINLNPAITVFSDASNSYGMDLGYDASVSRYRTRIFCPALAEADIALSTRAANATTQANFADRLVIRGDTGNIEMLSQTTVSGYLRVNGNVPIISAGSGVCMGLQNDGYAAITLNGTGANVGYIDFSQNGTDYLTRIISFPSKEMNYWADKHIFANTDNNITFMSLNDTYTANIRGSCGMINSCFVNTNNAASTTALNPSVTVYDNGGYRYGMDLGYNPTTARFRTRIFCPNLGSGDIALSVSTLSPTSQSNFTDRLIVRGDTGNVEINGAITVTTSELTPLLISNPFNATFTSLASFGDWPANSLNTTDLMFGRSADNYQCGRIAFTARQPNTGTSGTVFALGYRGFPFLTCDQFNTSYFYDGFGTIQAKIVGNVARSGLVYQGEGVFTTRHLQTTDINRFRCIGTAADAFPNGYFIEFMNQSNGGVGSISFNGANTVYNSSSDYRLKTNIQPLSNPLAKILQLNPKSYTMIESQMDSYGFIAHEVAEIIPELVMGEKDAVDEEGKPRYQQIDYSRFTPYTVGAIKDLYSLIETLQSQVQTLQSQVSLLNQ